ncbi:MAG TPA: hypothetical protein VGG90_04510 [Candidatus Dormibacteraeota bacterium]
MTPVLDTAKAATVTVPMAGGTVTATGSDGAVFTLTIPNHALLGAQKVTMTPVMSIDGLPFSGGLGAAVQLEPDGLQLFAAATLVIKPGKALAIPSQVGFAYHGSGQEMFLYPPGRRGAITFKIFHFSGEGIAIGTKAEVEAQSKRQPTSAEDQAAQQIAAELQDILAQERRDQLLGKNPDDSQVDKATFKTIEDMFNRVVKPKIEKALADETLIDDAINTALGWERMIALLGIDNGQYKAMEDYIAKMLPILFDHAQKAAYDRCFTKHDPSAAQRMLYLVRVAALLGIKEADQTVVDDIGKCLTFKLDFSTNGPFMHDSCGVYANATVKALVLNASSYTGSQSLSISGVAPDPSGSCDFAYSNWQATMPFKVFSLTFEMNYVNDPAKAVNPAPEVSDVVLAMDPGDASVSVNIKSQPDQKHLIPATFRGDGGWAYWHRDEGGAATGFYAIQTWVVPAKPDSPFVATKTYDRPLVIDAGNGATFAAGMTEKTTFTLTLAPGA